MLSALLEDFCRIPKIEVVSLLHRDQFPNHPGPSFHWVDCDTEERQFRETAAKADFTLVIAPEFDDILAKRCQWVEESGGRLLGPSLTAVRLTADKYALCQFLQTRQVSTPETRLLSAETPENREPRTRVGGYADPLTNVRGSRWQVCQQFPAVLKPRWGAGSLATFVVESPSDLGQMTAAAKQEGCKGDMILQPLIPGQAASVAFLIGPKQRMPLLPATQEFSDDGRFHYHGGSLPLPVELADRARGLASKAIKQVPDLLGFVGADLVLGQPSDGSQDYVIEINPRLTTSYIGLRALAETNLAEALLDVAIGKEITLKWRPGRIQFHSDGRISS
jgi:predicted ATP-grasp superfamily ATP-dependent carboligase